MLKLGRAVHVYSRVPRLGSQRTALANPAKSYTHVQIRCLSAGDVFGKVDLSKLSNLPDAPLPLPDKISITELVASGQSVLNELGLFSWYNPSSYIRWALESLHIYADIPWWGAIATVSIALRLLTIYVPIKAQKNTAIQSRYKTELKEFNNRMKDSQAEGDNMQVQQILLEQHKFMKSKGISMVSQLGVMTANGFVFMSNFFAIKKMTSVDYPGFDNGGAFWFTNLVQADPYLGLPIIAAASTFAAIRLGIDTGASSDQMSPGMRLTLQYGFPIFIVGAGWWLPSGLCVHWVASNTFSLVLAGLFKIDPVRRVFNIPPVVKHERTSDTNAIREMWSARKAKKAAPPSLASLRKSDYNSFKQAGTGKPSAL